MKQKLKFFAVVFGLTLAMVGSIESKAQTLSDDIGASCHCEGTKGTCATVTNPAGETRKLPGKKVCQ